MRATIKQKLGVTLVVFIHLSAVSAFVAIHGLGALRNSVDDLVDGAAQEVSLSDKLGINLLALVRVEKNMILADSQSEIQQYDTQLQKLRQDGAALQKKLAAVAHDESQQKLAAFQATWEQWLPVQDKIRTLMTSPDGRAQAEAISEGEGRDLVRQGEAQLEEITQLSDAFMLQSKQDAEDDYETNRALLIAAVVASLLIAIGSGVWISTIISRGLSRAGGLAQAVANGDLTTTFDKVPNDEIGDLIGHVNRMVEQLRVVVADALSASDNVSAGSQELSASAEELSQGATEQASAAEAC